MPLYDVIIIGGGVTGAAIARELSRYELKTALLEKEEELAFGVSKSNSGIIHPGTQNPVNSLKGRLCVQGNTLMRRLSDELGLDFKEVGELIVIFDKADLPELARIKDEGEQLGVRGLELVDRKWLDANEPNLGPHVVAALYAPSAGIISPYRLVYALAENAAQNGVEILASHQVTAIKKTDAGFEVSAGGKTFAARYVINAAGLNADTVSQMPGIGGFTIKPRKGEEFLLDKKRENITRHLIFPLPTKSSKGTLIIKTSDGNPMIGPTAEETDNKEDLSTTTCGLETVLASVKKMLPSIDANDIIAYFAGLRPAAGSDFIIRHEPAAPGFVNVAGIQSPGLTAAPAIALMTVDILKANGLALREKPHFKNTREPVVHLFAIPLEETRELIKTDQAYGDIVCRCEMVSAKEIRDAIKRGARTLDGIKFRTRAQAGRCHGGFCTTRILKIMHEELGADFTEISKRGKGSELIKKEKPRN